MINVAQVRAQLEAAELERARSVVLRLVQLAGRRRVFAYAQKNYIVDFDLLDVVSQRHRDRRNQIITRAQGHRATATAATTIEELLAVFDLIAPNL